MTTQPTTTDDETKGATALRDRADVTDLISRYYAALDEQRLDDLAGFLGDDVRTVTPLGEVTGREAVLALIGRTFGGYARRQHTVGNVLVEVDPAGDRAEVRFNGGAAFGQEGLRPTRTSGSVCRFGVRRAGDGWLIDRMRITPVWVAEEGGAS